MFYCMQVCSLYKPFVKFSGKEIRMTPNRSLTYQQTMETQRLIEEIGRLIGYENSAANLETLLD